MKDGEAVLDLLARHPNTAKFISTKLARRFVSDNPPSALVDRMAKTFLETDGDIRAVLKTMFDSPEFWSRDAYRAKIKKPFELVASAARAVGAEVDVALDPLRLATDDQAKALAPLLQSAQALLPGICLTERSELTPTTRTSAGARAPSR